MNALQIIPSSWPIKVTKYVLMPMNIPTGNRVGTNNKKVLQKKKTFKDLLTYYKYMYPYMNFYYT